MARKGESGTRKLPRKDLINKIINKNPKQKFLSDSQREYHEILKESEITICTGPAGVGKSYIAMKAAVDLLADPNTPYEKIIIVRPAVEAEEKLGALPGNVEEKLDPYIFPSYYLLNKIIGKDVREKLKNMEIIEVFALAYMRGMNIDNSILIFEEAQNCTPKQMKLLLTLGLNLVILLMFSHPLSAQKTIIRGQVTDENKVPLVSVTITVAGKNTTAITTANGEFSIEAETRDKLKFSFVAILFLLFAITFSKFKSNGV